MRRNTDVSGKVIEVIVSVRISICPKCGYTTHLPSDSDICAVGSRANPRGPREWWECAVLRFVEADMKGVRSGGPSFVASRRFRRTDGVGVEEALRLRARVAC